MRALVSHALGGPETLAVEHIEPRSPRRGELLLDVLACGVNFTDLLFLRGGYQEPSTFPLIPGGELCGVVVEAGAETDIPPGTRVICRASLGGMAERVTVAQHRCIPAPDALTDDAAAIIQFSYATSHYALTRCIQVGRGDSILVLGATGGVGSAAVAIAKALGARVCAAASSHEKLEGLSPAPDWMLAYDASPTDLQLRDFTSRLKQTLPTGFDAIVDPVGGLLSEPAMRATAQGGAHLVIGFAGGVPTIPLNLPLLKSFSIVGVSWHDFLTRKPNANRAMIEELVSLHLSGRLLIQPPTRISLEEAPCILHSMASRTLRGKYVVIPSRGVGEARS